MNKKIDWAYILREILLIFIGISLAIWFNNWNANRKVNQELKNSIELTKNELESNLNTLTENQKVPEQFFSELNQYFSEKGDRSLDEIKQFNEASEMVTITPGGGISINFKYPIMNLKTTSWDIFKSRASFHELQFSCVDQIENCYQLTNRFQEEFKESHLNLRNGEIEKFRNTLNYSG